MEIIKTPFQKVLHERYYTISGCGELSDYPNRDDEVDRKNYSVANYCTNKELMQQRGYMEVLNRLLWRYSMEHDGDKLNWNNTDQPKYVIKYDTKNNFWGTDYVKWSKYIQPHFYTERITESAITEIIEPFLEAHPDFKF